jgi:quercetin dioxygenase-like cupin family protein
LSDLPPIRRVVTGHDGDGRAMIKADNTFATEPNQIGDASFALIWATASVPVDNNDEIEGRDQDAGITINQGSVIRIVDFLPGGVSPMHRTSSIDYGVVLSGQIELETENGDKTVVGTNSIIVQRGTNHRWRNPSDTETCRVAFVLIEAAAYLHNGVPLSEIKDAAPAER